jgi:hypothetical protein
MSNTEKYERGDTVVLYHTFLTIEDKEPTTVINPRITIRHINSSDVLIIDVNEATMSLVAETTYYYKWVVPSDAFIGNHAVEFQAVCDGEYQEENETIEIVD